MKSLKGQVKDWCAAGCILAVEYFKNLCRGVVREQLQTLSFEARESELLCA